MRKYLNSILFLLVTCTFACGTKAPDYTASGEKVLVVQRDVSLYRKEPHIWPAKGKVLFTKDELLFIPTPYYGINIGGKDTTFISLDNIEKLQKYRTTLVFPFGLKVSTRDGETYSFVTVGRNSLALKIENTILKQKL